MEQRRDKDDRDGFEMYYRDADTSCVLIALALFHVSAFIHYHVDAKLRKWHGAGSLAKGAKMQGDRSCRLK